jgi:peptidyl-prolyl cis-trans isomerase B (cyclophilin B)
MLLLVVSLNSGAQPQQDLTPVGLIKTPLGEIHIRLLTETPNHRASFIQLATQGYWDSLTFNRVIPDFVAQGGCPDTEQGFTDPEYLLEPEFVEGIVHSYGAVGAGRDDNPGKLSARCQFYIVHQKEGIPRLDNNYTVFGHVIKGMDVVDRIVHAERDEQDEPLAPITLTVSVEYLTVQELKALEDHRDR